MSRKKTNKQQVDNVLTPDTINESEIQNEISNVDENLKGEIDELKSTIKPSDSPEQQKNDSESIEDAFNEFKNSKTGFETDTPETKIELPINEKGEFKIDTDTQFKIKMFAGFFFFLLAGANNFVLNFIKKTNVPYDEMGLTEDEVDMFIPYLETPEVINFINKIPAWVIGVAHFEYMMLQKHAELAPMYKKQPIKRMSKTK